jgi:flagellum-specific peptidoglycan hydrolase FlgJ
MSKKAIKLFFICSLLLLSCKSKKKLATSSNKKLSKVEKTQKKPKIESSKVIINETKITPTPKNASYTEVVNIYIDNYSKIAKEEMVQYGIPASITLAQGILESGAGRSALSKKSNNHFGIKCHKGWTGQRVFHDDDELQECFRKYKDPKYSFRDHSLFLTQRTRYEGLFAYKKNDYKSWAKGLRKAGYATDPKYPQKLINIIETYQLYSYDVEVLGKKNKRKKEKSSKVKTYFVLKGDTLFSISRKFDITVAALKRYNGLVSNTINIGQELYVHSVKN